MVSEKDTVEEMPYFKTVIIILFIMTISGCSQSPVLEYDPEIAVPLSFVEDLQFSDTSRLTVKECEQRMLDFSNPKTIRENNIVPNNHVVLIDLDEVYKVWDEYSLVPLCIEANFGLYRTTGDFNLPNIADVWSINMNE